MKTAQILILTFAASLAARADFSYTTTRKSTGGAMGQMAASAGDPVTKHYLKGQKMKIEHGDTATVIDFEAQTITSINPSQKTYSVAKFADLGKAIENAGVDVKADVKKTGAVKTINGFNASEVVMTMDVDMPQARQAGMKMQMEMDMWVSPDVPGSRELRAFFERNGSRFPWTAVAGGSGRAGMQKAMADLQRQVASLNGVPVLQIIKMKSAGGGPPGAQGQGMEQARARLEEMQKQGGPQAAAAAQALARMGAMSSGGSLFEMTMESGNFSTGTIPDAVFAVPAGYQHSEK